MEFVQSRRARVLIRMAATILITLSVLSGYKMPAAAEEGGTPVSAGGGRSVLTPREAPAGRQKERLRLAENYARLPLGFEANQGQTDGRVEFLSRGRGFTLFLTGDEAVLEMQGSGSSRSAAGGSKIGARQAINANPVSRSADSVLRMKLVGTSPQAKAEGSDELPGKANYFIGNDPDKWRASIPTYARVRYSEVYPGVDLVYYGDSGRLEYDFRVAPGADSKSIRMGLEGVDQMWLSPDGDLVLRVAGGEVRFQKPVVYQTLTTSGKRFVNGRYRVLGKNRIGFDIGRYDRSQPLIIDPALSYSTFLGGTATTNAAGVALDSSGNVYIAGSTTSTDFPHTTGAFQTTLSGPQNVFVTELNPTGTALVFSTYLGGTGVDTGLGIAVDTTGVYVTGGTTSTNFPIPANTTPFRSTNFGGEDAFVTKLSPNGSSLIYSTYLGGSSDDQGNSIALNNLGNAFVTGHTASSGIGTSFPVTKTAFQTINGGGATGTFDAFVTELNPNGTSPLVYSTYLGGTGNDIGHDIAVDSTTGNAYVVGETASTGNSTTDFPSTAAAAQRANKGGVDAFVAEVNPAQSGAASLVYSTYLGGSADDLGLGIALDSSANAYVTGQTSSTDLPVTAGVLQAACGTDGACNASGGVPAPDAFVAKINSTGSVFTYVTYLGGSGADQANSIAVDATGNAYITGNTQSTDFPTVSAVQSTCSGLPCDDAFVASVNPGATTLVYSTYLGGSLHDEGDKIALDSAADAYVAGSTTSSDFPTTAGVSQPSCPMASPTASCNSGFVFKLGAAAPVQPSPAILAFGPQLLNTTSQVQTTTLTNNSATPFTIAGVVPSGDYTVATTGTTCVAAAVVQPTASCTIAVSFTPASTGAQTGTLIITDDAANSPQTVSLTGTGTTSLVSLSPPSLTFSNQPVGTTGSQTLIVTNAGGAALTFTAPVAATAGFAIAATGTTCSTGAPLQPGASCTVNVTFSPTASGTVSGTLTLTDSAPDSPQSVVLTGTGVAAVVTLTPSTLDFGSQTVETTSAAKTVTLQNTGNATLSVTSYTLGGSNGGDFAISSNACGTSVATGRSCVLSVTFKPAQPGSPTPRAGTILIADNASGTPQAITLTGLAADFTLAASPTTASVSPGGSTPVSVTVTPVGGFASAVSLVCQTPPNFLGSCAASPASVTPNGSAASSSTVTITTLAPAGVAPRSGPRGAPGPLSRLPALPWIALVLGLATLTAVSRQGRRRAWIVLAATTLSVLLWASCGGTTNSGNATGTVPGTYTFTMTGTFNSLVHSTTMTLTVK